MAPKATRQGSLAAYFRQREAPASSSQQPARPDGPELSVVRELHAAGECAEQNQDDALAAPGSQSGTRDEPDLLKLLQTETPVAKPSPTQAVAPPAAAQASPTPLLPPSSPQVAAPAARETNRPRHVYDRAPGRPMCRFGRDCYRKNPAHFSEVDHPADHPFFIERLPPASVAEQLETKPAPHGQKRDAAEIASASPPEARGGSAQLSPATSTEGSVQQAFRNQRTTCQPQPNMPQPTSVYDGQREVWLKKLQECFLVSCPEECLLLFEMAMKLAPTGPIAAFSPAGINLLGPFRLLAGTLPADRHPTLADRGLHDPPEFLPLFGLRHGGTVGYWRDDPVAAPKLVVMSRPLTAGPGICLQILSHSAVGALHALLQGAAKNGSLRASEARRLASRVAQCAAEANLPLECDVKAAGQARKKATIAPTTNGMGLVVPYNKRTQIGYRELHLTGSELRKLLDRIRSSSAGDRKRHQADLDELINWANIANDESDFGASLQLGLDLLNHDAMFAPHVQQMLVTAYTLLGRGTFATIVREHAALRRQM